MDKKVSICVPVYNTAKYLPRCIDSLLQQTYSNLEIILVDDGSTDGSEVICDEYAELDDRVIVIHKENGGEASARNAGLHAATGEFIMFIDNDDEYVIDAARLLVMAMENENVDLAIGGCLEIRDDVTQFATSHLQHFTAKEAARLTLSGTCNYGMSYLLSIVNAKMFRRNIISKAGLVFDEGFVAGNDSIFTSEYLKHTRSIYDVLTPIYKYYKFHVSERVQGMAWFYPDTFFLYTIVRDKLLQIARYDINEHRAEALKEYYIFLDGMQNAVTNESYLEKSLLTYLTTLYNETDIVKQGAVLDLSSDGKKVGEMPSKIISYLITQGQFSEVEKLMREISKLHGLLPESSEYIKSIVKENRVELSGINAVEGGGVVGNELFLTQLGGIISTINDLQKQIEDKNAYIINQQSNIEAQNDYSADLQNRLNIQSAQAEGLQEQLSIQSAQAEKLHEQLNKKSAQADELQEQLNIQKAKAEKQQAALDDITGSASWRVTKPLRKVKATFLKNK
jgi:glycosyltransferase involved in cell wall biosynthesis